MNGFSNFLVLQLDHIDGNPKNNLLNNFLEEKLREDMSIIFTSHIQPTFECKTLEIER